MSAASDFAYYKRVCARPEYSQFAAECERDALRNARPPTQKITAPDGATVIRIQRGLYQDVATGRYRYQFSHDNRRHGAGGFASIDDALRAMRARAAEVGADLGNNRVRPDVSARVEARNGRRHGNTGR